MKSAKFSFSLLSAALAVTMGLASEQALAVAVASVPSYCNSGVGDVDPSTNDIGMKTSDVKFTTQNNATVSINSTDCYGETNEGPGGNLAAADINLLDWGSDFVKLDKTDESSIPLGGLSFVLTADINSKVGDWGLTVTDADIVAAPNLPIYMDLIFSLKGSNGSGLYLFDEILIGGTNGGDFKISFTNNGGQFPALSNAVLFGRFGETVYVPPNEEPPTQTPEPGMLFLVGAGLLGLGIARRRKSA